MKKAGLCFVFIMMTSIMAGPAWALDDGEHVVQAPDGKGDLVIFPFYAAFAGGWETKLTVTNTDSARSTTAKVVVRSGGYGEWIQDFLIYLSPGDVWTGSLLYDDVKGAIIYSTDDSVQSAPGAWAAPDEPLHLALGSVCSADPYGNQIGYVTVTEVWSSAGLYMCAEAREQVDLGAEDGYPASKECIKEAYDNAFYLTNATPFNVLTGHYEVSLVGVFLAADRASVFRDYDHRVMEFTQVESMLGVGASNNLCEMEAVLSKETIALPYINNGGFNIYFVTFPTKLPIVDPDCNYDATNACNSPSDGSDAEVFKPSFDYSARYDVFYWDAESNMPGGPGTIGGSKPPPESLFYAVNIAATRHPFVYPNFQEGWYRYTFDDATQCAPLIGSGAVIDYTGVPALASTWIFAAPGIAISPSAHDNGVVTYNGQRIRNYQHHNVNSDRNGYIVNQPDEFTVP